MLESIVYLTCEIKGRDLDSRALIGAHLLKRGYTVVIGQFWNMVHNAHIAPRGCFLFKTVNAIQTNAMAACKPHGHKIAAADEEVFAVSEAKAADGTAPRTFEYCDLYLAINDAHKRAVERAYPESLGRVRAVGSARIDLLRAARYVPPHPTPYILINTSFGLINPAWGDPALAMNIFAKALATTRVPAAEVGAIVNLRVEYERSALVEIERLIDWFSHRDDHVVLRPHPQENANRWRAKLETSRRSSVVENSDPYQWMQHANLMIHNDSTTGVESAIMGVPCVNLSPLDAWGARSSLRDLNFSVRSASEAFEPIAGFLAGRRGQIKDKLAVNAFPRNCAAATASALISTLPRPRPIAAFPWVFTTRHESQKLKFDVSLDEFTASLSRAFKLAGGGQYQTQQLMDSVFVARPL